MALRPISIPPLQERLPIVDDQRRPVPSFIRALNTAFRQIATAYNGQAEIVLALAELAGIVDAQGNLISDQAAIISGVVTSQEAAADSLSLQNSGVIDEAGALGVDSTGLITIQDHTRIYGDSVLNPPVFVQGDTLATGAGAGTTLFIWYDDMSRAGGAVTYTWGPDSAETPQRGARHYVGLATIPSVGSTFGSYNRPR